MNAPRILSIRPNRVQIEWDAEPNTTKYDLVGGIANREIAPVRRRAAILTRSGWTGTIEVRAFSGGAYVSSPAVSVSTPAYTQSALVTFPGFFNGSMVSDYCVFGNRTVFISTRTDAGAYLTVKEDNTFTSFDIPELPNVAVAYRLGSIVMRSSTSVLILEGEVNLSQGQYFGAIKVHEVELVGTPVSSVLYKGASTLRSGAVCRRGAMCALKSGGVLASVWEPTGATGVSARFYYFQGVSWNEQLVHTAGPAYAYNTSVCMEQHPSGEIYHFAKQDGGSHISRLRLMDNGSGVTVKDYLPTYITTEIPGNSAGNPYGPHGEFPKLRAIANPSKNSMVLAFQDENWVLFNMSNATFTDYDSGLWAGFKSSSATPEFSKGTKINCVNIASDGSFQNNEMPDWVERLSHFSLAIDSGCLLIHYAPLDLTDWTRCESFVRVFDTSWGPRIPAGLLNGNGAPIGFMGTHPVNLGPDIQVRIHDAIAASPPPTGDTIAPTIAITSPPGGSTVSGVITITTNAADNVGVASVSFLRGSTVVASDTTAPYSCSWDTRTVPNGVHNITAVAKDAAGNTSSATVSISVNNPITPIPPTDTIKPTVRFVRPFSGASLPRGSVSVEIVATDNVAVFKIELYIDNSLKRTVNGSTLLYQWNTKPGHQRGPHTLKAKAFDSAGNMSEVSIPVTVS